MRGLERRGTEGQTVRQEGGGGEQHRNTVRQRGDAVAQRVSETGAMGWHRGTVRQRGDGVAQRDSETERRWGGTEGQ